MLNENTGLVNVNEPQLLEAKANILQIFLTIGLFNVKCILFYFAAVGTNYPEKNCSD
jgi:hypothetical protein